MRIISKPLIYTQVGMIATMGLIATGYVFPQVIPFTAGASMVGFAGYHLWGDEIKKLWQKLFPKSNSTKINEVLSAIGYGKARYGEFPKQLNKNKSDKHLVYELRPGMAPSDFMKMQERLNSHLQAETDIYTNNSQLHIEVMSEHLPKNRMYEPQEPPGKMILPIPIGYSRSRFIWADLTELPHLVVAGETYGGKSNFLHQAIASLVHQDNVRLYVIDLKKVEFGYLKDHAVLSMTLPDTVKILEEICLEMINRMNLLYRERIPKIQEYKHSATKEMPYIVIIIDELSQLSPKLAHDKATKELRIAAHQYLTDILCLARALGIHVIVSTQRPDRDVLPGQLKANIPAALCFKVKNEINSGIVLDNNKADLLPRIKGRAIWQFDVEREVQVQHLPVGMAKRLLPKVPLTKPANVEVTADGRV
jgi:hypothetical protein